MLGHHRAPPNEAPFKLRFAGGPVMAHLDPLSPRLLKKKDKKKNVIKFEPLGAKLSGSAHVSIQKLVTNG